MSHLLLFLILSAGAEERTARAKATIVVLASDVKTRTNDAALKQWILSETGLHVGDGPDQVGGLQIVGDQVRFIQEKALTRAQIDAIENAIKSFQPPEVP